METGRGQLQGPLIFRLHEIACPPGAGEDVLREKAARVLGLKPANILALRVRRRSLDARKKPEIRFVHVVDVDVDEAPAPGTSADPAPADPPDPFDDPPRGREPMRGPAVVVGAGPAGLAASWALARLGFRPLVLERGRPLAARARDVDRFLAGGDLDPESNVLFGEGGAGAWSDGKLRTRIGDPLLVAFLKLLVAAGAPERILWDARPHLGTDGVRRAAAGIRTAAEALGARFVFEARVEGLEIADGAVRALTVSGERTEAGAVVLAVGGSARDSFAMLQGAGVAMEPKPFQMGLRVEHPQEGANRMQYGRAARLWDLPPAEYALTARQRPPFHSVFTFCMCPGGMVIPSVSEPGRLCVNGMSFADRGEPRGNAALVATIPLDRFAPGVLGGVALQRAVEEAGYIAGGGGFAAPAQDAASFLKGRPPGALPPTSYVFGTRPAELGALLPGGVGASIRRALGSWADRFPLFRGPETVLLGPESRGSCPVRILRHRETLESETVSGLVPAGEGAGYAGGIASAGVDGFRAALAVARRFACPP